MEKASKKMKQWIILILVFLVSFSVVLHSEVPEIEILWFEGLKPFRIEGFISPDVCNQCHSELYDMWNGSMHASALDDPLFRAATKLFIKDASNPGELADSEHCVACHTPIAYRSGQIKGSSDDYSKADDVTGRAISCDMCHSINEVVRLGNGSFNTDPGQGEDDPGVKRGPHDDAEAMYHESAYSELHTSSEICGACHNVTHLWYMTKLEGTYDEWYNSPYNSADPEKRVTCQDCHMRQSPGKPSTGMTERPDYPGTSSEMGEERPHIYRHSVVGANAFITEKLGYPEKAQLARERLQNAAVLEVLPPGAGKSVSDITVRVKNEGAGHMLPTGVTEFRQMWLDVTVTDSKGKTVFSSGTIDSNGDLTENTCIYQTVFGDSQRNPTLNVAKASRMLHDHRIHPKGFLDETFHFKKPCKRPLTIKAELKYRSIIPSVAAMLLGDDTINVPVITMTSIEKKVE